MSEEARAIPTLTLRLAPEFRRCAIYLFIGAWLVAAALVFLAWCGGNFGPLRLAQIVAELPILTIISLPWLVFALLIWQWRLRVDVNGVARRRLWTWDLWSWDTFASGRIVEASVGWYVDPHRPWWRKSLSFVFCAKDDKSSLRALIKRVWVPPSDPESPKEVTLRYAAIGKDIRLNAGGIVIEAQVRATERRQEAAYIWDDVSKLQITRPTHDCGGFSRLQLVLPDRKIHVTEHTVAMEGRLGPKLCRQTTLCFLTKWVPANRILYIAREGPPQFQEECAERLAKTDKELQVNRVRHHVLLSMCAIMVMLGLDRWEKMAPGPFIYFTLGLPVFLMVRRDVTRERVELEAWMVGHGQSSKELGRDKLPR